jgi:integrase
LIDAQPESVQVGIVLSQWYDEHGSRVASAEANRFGVVKLLEKLGTAFVSDLTPIRINQFIADMCGEGYSESYINRHLTVLRAALNHAHENGRLRAIPPIRTLREQPKPKHVFTPDQMAEFFDRARATEHLFRFCMIAANTLARPDAVKALSPFQVDVAAGIIHLNPPGRRQTKKFRPSLPITDTLRPWLRVWDGSPYVHYRGRLIRDIGNSFARVGADMGLEVSPYCIRHTMATELAKANVPEGQIARFMGHIPPGTKRSTEFYIHYRPDFLRDAVTAIDAYFERLPVRLAMPSKLRVVK